MVRGFLTNAPAQQERIDDAVLAVDEACTNAIRHAYGGDASGSLLLELSVDGEDIEIVVQDEGRPADAERLAARPLEAPSREAVAPGGLGVQLMRGAFDEVRFEPGGEKGNRVVMRMKRDASSDGECARAGAPYERT
jgi:serine/threonine-protein kinase RsbW